MSIAENFWPWYESDAGAELEAEFVTLATSLVAKGHNHLSGDGICHFLRIQRMARYDATDARLSLGNYRISNSIVSRLTRMVMIHRPDLRSIFSLKPLTSRSERDIIEFGPGDEYVTGEWKPGFTPKMIALEQWEEANPLF